MTDWSQTLAICRRELEQDRCCLGPGMKAAGWCSVDRHADRWRECGMEVPNVMVPDTEQANEEGAPDDCRGVLEAAGGGPDARDAGLRQSESALRTQGEPEIAARESGPADRESIVAGGGSPGSESVTAGEVLPPLPGGQEREAATSRLRTLKANIVLDVLEMGAILAEWKGKLSHGEWLPFLVEGGLDVRSANKVRAICADARISNWRLNANLPVSVEPLYELTRLNDAQFERALAADEPPTLAVIREIRHAQPPSAPAPTIPEGVYRVILADPPWERKTWNGRVTDRSAERHYDTMTIDRIASIGNEVIHRAADDAALFLWVPAGPRRVYEDVIAAWGFEPKGDAFVWAKDRFVTGLILRHQHEICLLGTRGTPKRRAKDVSTLIEAPVRQHSRKPDEAHERIERLYPGPYLELFGRRRRRGWTVWGNHPALQAEAAE